MPIVAYHRGTAPPLTIERPRPPRGALHGLRRLLPPVLLLRLLLLPHDAHLRVLLLLAHDAQLRVLLLLLL